MSFVLSLRTRFATSLSSVQTHCSLVLGLLKRALSDINLNNRQHPISVMPAARYGIVDHGTTETPSHTLLSFLQSQSQNTLSRLYQKPSSCLSIFRYVLTFIHGVLHQSQIPKRLLGPLERQLVMNLLWLESAIPASTMLAWVTREGRKYVDCAPHAAACHIT